MHCTVCNGSTKVHWFCGWNNQNYSWSLFSDRRVGFVKVAIKEIFAMNDLKGLARIVLIGVSAYIVISAVTGLVLALPTMFFIQEAIFYAQLKYWLAMAVGIAFALVLLYILIWKADWVIERLIGKDDIENAKSLSPGGVYRLAMVIMGTMYLYWSISTFASIAGRYFSEWGRYEGEFMWPIGELLGRVLMFFIGIYLLTGAPHFVKWQVKKTLEQCEKLNANMTNDSEEPQL